MENETLNNQFIRVIPGKFRVFAFLIGFLGLQVAASLVIEITGLFNPYFVSTMTGSAIINFVAYATLFASLFVLLFDYLKSIYIKIGSFKTYLRGFLFGLVIIAFTILYQMIASLFIDIQDNNNETAINSIVGMYPILSIIVFGFVGPICEELVYRFGLFGGIKKKNTALAYAVTALVFGLVHFDFTATGNALKMELINLPNYVISGLLMCLFYSKYGIECSTVAHITNNLASIFIELIYLWK